MFASHKAPSPGSLASMPCDEYTAPRRDCFIGYACQASAHHLAALVATRRACQVESILMQLDARHATVGALEQLVPEAIAAGGSFAGWLPHPSMLTAAARARALASAQDSAVAECIRCLLRRAGLPSGVRVDRQKGGERAWPPGFVGSLCHKGTVVLGVIAESSTVPMIGIDLERMNGSDLGTIERTIASDGRPPGIDRQLGTLVAFSAKEAVFKAQYPSTQRTLDFSDIRLAWAEDNRGNFRAELQYPVLSVEVRCALVGPWVVSAAIAK